MNICFITKEFPPLHNGGVGTYFYELSKILADKGNKIDIITKGDSDKIIELNSYINVHYVTHKKIFVPAFIKNYFPRLFERLEYSFAVSKKLKELNNQFDIDIVETSEARFEAFWYYIFNSKPKFVIKLHTSEGLTYLLNDIKLNLDYKICNIFEKFWLLKADKVYGVTKAINKLSSRFYNYDFNKNYVIHNPIDLNRFQPSIESGFSKNKFNILYTGRLEFRKGVHILLYAFINIIKKNKNVFLTFLGNDCGMKNYLISEIDKAGINNKIVFADKCERKNIIKYYQKSSIVVVPSLWENFPYACIEPMACGKTVIASDTGGISEIVEHRKNGFLFSAGSVNELTNILLELIDEPELINKIGKEARKRIEELCRPDKIAEQTLNLYNRVINNV